MELGEAQGPLEEGRTATAEEFAKLCLRLCVLDSHPTPKSLTALLHLQKEKLHLQRAKQRPQTGTPSTTVGISQKRDQVQASLCFLTQLPGNLHPSSKRPGNLSCPRKEILSSLEAHSSGKPMEPPCVVGAARGFVFAVLTGD